ncbi:MAG: RluA family pseudouridine synthase [Planctomycetota bacterium]|jgi:23S rRNA pseudouridine1911/1915/1917 synthase
MVDDLPPRFDFDQAEERRFDVAAADAGARLDRYLGPRLPAFSRAAVQRLIKAGAVLLNGSPARPASRVHDGDRVDVDVPALLPPTVEPEDLPLHVLHEDASFVVLDKAPGMAVHPGRGRHGGTVANAVAFRYGRVTEQAGAYRPGIVHRLDLETSGVMVVALHEAAHGALSDAFRERKIGKEYHALVFGEPEHDEDRIDLALGRDLTDATRMAVRFDSGREAVTDVKVLERLDVAAHLLCRPRTGRTHQIRVHLQSRGHPLLGDATYARGRTPPVAVPRLMLHASRLVFPHPDTRVPVAVEAPLPADFRAVLDALREMG